MTSLLLGSDGSGTDSDGDKWLFNAAVYQDALNVSDFNIFESDFNIFDDDKQKVEKKVEQKVEEEETNRIFFQSGRANRRKNSKHDDDDDEQVKKMLDYLADVDMADIFGTIDDNSAVTINNHQEQNSPVVVLADTCQQLDAVFNDMDAILNSNDAVLINHINQVIGDELEKMDIEVGVYRVEQAALDCNEQISFTPLSTPLDIQNSLVLATYASFTKPNKMSRLPKSFGDDFKTKLKTRIELNDFDKWQNFYSEAGIKSIPKKTDQSERVQKNKKIDKFMHHMVFNPHVIFEKVKNCNPAYASYISLIQIFKWQEYGKSLIVLQPHILAYLWAVDQNKKTWTWRNVVGALGTSTFFTRCQKK